MPKEFMQHISKELEQTKMENIFVFQKEFILLLQVLNKMREQNFHQNKKS